jgi:membrane-associated protease RseP (regulator of RpoE activity)
VSDGGTGTYYVSMRDTTPYASFLSLNGSMLVLANPSLEIEGDNLTNNLLNKPYFVVNGWRDPLYPPLYVEPYLDHLRRGGVDLVHRPQKEGAHNVSWWPELRDVFEEFVRDHPRVPHPVRLTWQTDLRTTSQRSHWVVVTELGDEEPRPALPDLNRYEPAPMTGFGLFADGNRVINVRPASNASQFGLLPDDEVVAVDGKAVPSGQNLLQFLQAFERDTTMTLTVVRASERVELSSVFAPDPDVARIFYARTEPAGRVDVARDGNTIVASTRRVAAFTVLLSPDVFDFTQPIRIVADGVTVYEGVPAKSVETLMKWAALDNDRTMLFGAEVQVRLPR